MTAGSLFRISARRRAGAGAALLTFAAIAAPSTAKAISTDAAATAQAAAAAAGPVSTAATGARCIGPAFDDTPAFQAAIDTGHTVYAPALGGQCHITRALVMKTPGQIFHGDGRARTKIVIEPGFTGEGVFVAKTGEPGPVWRDFSVSFVQPDIDDRAKLTRYPPAFSALDTPRFEMEHMGCYVATTCIDMKGNSGGATIADLQMSAFEVGIDIDGSLDTVRVIDPHWWPFELSTGQQKIFSMIDPRHGTAVRVGRVDNLMVRGGFFLGGYAFDFFKSQIGDPFATLSNVNFDSTVALRIMSGNVHLSAVDFATNDGAGKALVLEGGYVTIASSHFFFSQLLKSAFIVQHKGALEISASQFETGAIDSTVLQLLGPGVLTLSGNQFFKKPGLYSKALVEVSGGTIVAVANYVEGDNFAKGKFIQISPKSPASTISSNSAVGWQ